MSFLPEARPGLVVMRVASANASADNGAVTDARWQSVIVVFNASTEAVEVAFPPAVTKTLRIHTDMRDLRHVKGSTIDCEKRVISIRARSMLVACEDR